MVKVICWDGIPSHPSLPTIPEGVLLVAYECKHPDYYIIDGYSFRLHDTVYHSKDKFLVCSDIDEIEIYRSQHN